MGLSITGVDILGGSSSTVKAFREGKATSEERSLGRLGLGVDDGEWAEEEEDEAAEDEVRCREAGRG